MRVVVSLAIALCFLSESSLAGECPTGAEADLLTVRSWAATEDSTGYMRATRIRTDLHNSSELGIRMVEGYIEFQDVLKRQIIRIRINEDFRIAPSTTAEHSGLYRDGHRLVQVLPDDVIVYACTLGVVFDDGTVRRYDGEE